MWTLDKVGSLQGKVAIVTGGNSGLGYQDVKVLASKGAKVILASRSSQRGEKAKTEIIDELIHDKTKETIDLISKEQLYENIQVEPLDLASLGSVNAFGGRFLDAYDRLDILMNNAGIMTTPYGLTEDGFEQQLGVNHLGHFALTGLLFPMIKTTPEARVVTISSLAHKSGRLSFANLMYEDGSGYSPMGAYGRSKLANLLFTYELQRKINQTVYDTRVLAAHPGGANTNLARHIDDSFIFKTMSGVLERLVQSAYEGALPGLRAALDPQAYGGEYYGPSGWRQVKGKPVLVQSNKLSHNKIVAKRLWNKSEELTGVSFDFS